MAYTTLQTTWSRPTLMIVSEKKPKPLSKSGANEGIWDLGGDNRELTIIKKYRQNNIVTLQLSEPHGLSDGDEIIVDGLGGDWNGTFTIIDSDPKGKDNNIKYNQIGPDSGDQLYLTPTAYKRKDNYLLIEFDKPHELEINDLVKISLVGTSGPIYSKKPILDDTFIGEYKVVDNKPLDKSNRIKLYVPGSDTGDFSRLDIKAMKRKNNLVTLRFYEDHPYEVGDLIEITRMGEDWNGVFTVKSSSVDEDLKELTYIQKGEDTSAFTDGFYDGTLKPKKVIRKKREDNKVTLEFEEPHGLSIGTPIVVEGLGEAFDRSASPYFIVSESSISGDNKKLRYTQSGPDTVGSKSSNIVFIKRSGNQTTIQFDQNHNFEIGESINISGVTISGIPSASYTAFNGNYEILDNAPGGRKNRIRYKDIGPDIINNNSDPITQFNYPDGFYASSPFGQASRLGEWREDVGVVKGIYNRFILAPQWIQTTNIDKTEYNVAYVERGNNEVTVEFSTDHDYRVGDQIKFYGEGELWENVFNGTFVVSNASPGGSTNKIKYINEGPNIDRIAAPVFGFPAKITRVGILRNPFTVRIRGGGMFDGLDPTDNNYVIRIRGGGFAPDSGTLTVTGQDFYYLTDDNRSELQINIERIEYRRRMINGRMRSYHVVDKKSFGVSWNDLETRHDKVSEYLRNSDPQPERLASAKRIVQWYNEHPGSFYLTLVYDGPDSTQKYIKYRLETYEVFFDNFNYTVKYRGENTDVWDISMTLVEA